MKKVLAQVLMVMVAATIAAFAEGKSKVESQRPVSSVVVRKCSGSQLSIRSDPNFNDAAMGGQRGASYIVKNSSASPCTIHGKPGIVLLDSRSRLMGSRIAPTRGGLTTIAAGKEVAFEVGYHSCDYAAESTGKDPKRCKNSRTALIRFYGITRVFSVKDQLDATGGIEQVEDWIKD
jgi:hypothetical protein